MKTKRFAKVFYQLIIIAKTIASLTGAAIALSCKQFLPRQLSLAQAIFLFCNDANGAGDSCRHPRGAIQD